MPFSYYDHLNRSQRADYDRSDAVGTVRLPTAMDCHAGLHALMDALAEEDRSAVERAAREIADSILDQLQVPQLRVQVRARRPVDDTGELHGLYEPRDGRRWAVITLWMRTAKKNQVVAFKSFLRTLLHELCHHLDYEMFELDETFHTEGFYRRESSLYHQIVRGSRAAPPRRTTQRRLFR
ncbi:MAG: hypothetical protein AAFU77_05705 [Myxococcota bacterium]